MSKIFSLDSSESKNKIEAYESDCIHTENGKEE